MNKWLSEGTAPKLRAAVAAKEQQEMSIGTRKHSPASEAKVAQEAMKGNETLAQLDAQYEVYPGQIQAWKKALTEGAAGVFGNGQDQRAGATACWSPACTRKSDN